MTNEPAHPPNNDSDTPAEAISQEELKSNTQSLQEQATALEGEVRILEARISNRDPVVLSELREENLKLKQRMNRLQYSLFALLTEALRPKTAGDLRLQLDVLRQGTIDYCKKQNISNEIWRNIEY
jgi:predicted oxidoreductase